METRNWWLLVLLGTLFVSGCSQEVTFNGKNRSLTYSCNGFESKVESEKDLKLLALGMRKAVQKMERARMEEYRVEIQAALRKRDRSRFEELAVNAKCTTKYSSTQEREIAPAGS
jgi:hypothetical protein